MIRFRILVAMKSELRCLPKRLQAHAICHGIGINRARKGVSRALESEPELLISFGVAGALSKNLRCGDLLCPDQLVHPHHDEPLATLNACQQGSPGRLLSWPDVVNDPTMKSELASRYDAVAVDNESASITLQARQSGVPCLILRSISDDASTQIPEQLLSCINEFGQPRLSDLSRSLWHHPAMARDLLRLGRQFSRARQTLRHTGQQLDLWLHGQPQQGWSHFSSAMELNS